MRILPPDAQITWGQSDENRLYPLVGLTPIEVDHASFYDGHFLGRVLTDRGIDVTLGSCCIGMLGYYSRARLVDFHGLTDREFARLPTSPERTLAGHEKLGSPAAIRARGVQLARWHDRDPERFRDLARIRFRGRRRGMLGAWSVVTWDPSLMAQIDRDVPEIQFEAFEPWLDDYLATLDTRTPQEVESDLAWFRGYYFDHVDDRERLAPLERWGQGP